MPGNKTKELKEGKLNKEDEATLRRGICPVCDSDKWIEGPHGGMAVNMACSNGHRFWVAGPFTPEY